MSRSYRLSSFFIGRSLVDLVIVAVQPSFYYIIVYWCTGLYGSFGSFMASWSILLLSCITAQSFGYLFGTLLMDVRKSIAAASVFMLTCMLASGFYLETMPTWISWFKYLSFSQYSFNAMMFIEFHQRDIVPNDITSRIWVDITALLAFIAGTRILSYYFLRFLHRN